MLYVISNSQAYIMQSRVDETISHRDELLQKISNNSEANLIYFRVFII